MKTCGKCFSVLPESDFSFKNLKTGRLSGYCKECNREYQREHYKRNKQDYADKQKRNSEASISRARNFVYEYLRSHPCIDCGYSDIRALEFDHIDSSNKRFNVSKAIHHGYSISAIEKEISKCAVRCANCHRIRTSIQFSWYKATLL